MWNPAGFAWAKPEGGLCLPLRLENDAVCNAASNNNPARDSIAGGLMEIVHVLMAEHRVIERMVRLMGKELGSLELSGRARPEFIYFAVDFFKNYADTTHHGKEEGILFRALEGKPLSPAHQSAMARLVVEHEAARREVSGLFESAQRYERGDLGAVAQISMHLRRLVALYPPHMALEDGEFFPGAMDYFTPEERARLLEEAQSYDAGMAHRKYAEMVARLEGG